MTLILTYASQSASIQFSDRLTTINRNEFDREANKTIVLVASDGIATVSLCGLAFFKKQHADIYLAESLTGELDDFFGSVPNMGPCLKNKRRKIDEMIHAMKSRAESLFKNNYSLRKHYFGLSVCGWRVRKGREIPFAYNLQKQEMHSKLLIYENFKMRYSTGPYEVVGHFPKGYISKDQEKIINDTLDREYGSLKEFYIELESLFINLIRQSSKDTNLVGMDAMIVFLPPPRFKKIEIKHLPIEIPHANWNYAKNVPSMFTPWIIGQRNFYSPSLMTLASPNFVHYVDDTQILFAIPGNDKGVTSISPYKRKKI